MNKLIYTLLSVSFALLAYSQKSKYSVISMDKITDTGLNFEQYKEYKTLYRGVSNPLHIAVNSAKSFTASAYGLKKVKDNFYYFSVTDIASDTTSIAIDIKLNNGKYKKERHMFLIKDLPWYTAVIGGKLHPGTLTAYTKNELLNAKFSGQFFMEHLSFTVTVRSVEIAWGDGTWIQIEGDILNDEAKKKLLSLPVGSIIQVRMYIKSSSKACIIRGDVYKILIIEDDGINDAKRFLYPKIYPLKGEVYKNEVNTLKIVPPYNTRFNVSGDGVSKIDSLHYQLDARKTKYDYSDLSVNLTNSEDSTHTYTTRIYFEDREAIISTINGKGCTDCIVKLKRSDLPGAYIAVMNNRLVDEQKWLNVVSFTINANLKKYKVKGNHIPVDIATEILANYQINSLTIEKIKYIANDQFPSPPEAAYIDILLQ